MRRRQQGRFVRWAALALGVAALLVAARGLERHNTWYLASDQFAFLSFAGDLAHGTIFHDSSALELAVPRPKPEIVYDALAQTYFWRAGKLYSRYPPGFPALLALAGLIGGEQAQHWLNPALYLTILALLGWLTWVLVRPNDRALGAGCAVAAMWLLLLLPTDVHLWGITVARDLPTHLLALLALLAALGRRHALSGLLLGLACTIRPDAVLYVVSLGALFWLDGTRLRPLVFAALAFLIGLVPLFAYNTVTQGHPFAFTQGGEFRAVLGALLTPDAAYAQGIKHGSGGAFRLANLWQTLPGNLRHLGKAFGWLGVLTVLGVVWALRVRRPLAAALVPYPLVALLFYSCWSHPDARYLAGAVLCALPLTAVGAVVSCRWVADERRGLLWRVLAVLCVLVVAGQRWLPPGLRLPGFGPAALALAAALAASAVLPALPRIGAAARRLVPLAAGLALAIVALGIVFGSRGSREPFQAEQIARAREVLGAMIPPGSLVIASESLGRPAENIAHYVGADTFYPGELPLLYVDRAGVVVRYLIAGRRAFFLLRSEDRETMHQTKPLDPARVVARAQGRELHDWLVDPQAAPLGAVLYEIEPSPITLELRKLIAQQRTSAVE